MILGADTFAGVKPSITGGCTLNTLRVLYKLQYNTYIYILRVQSTMKEWSDFSRSNYSRTGLLGHWVYPIWV